MLPATAAGSMRTDWRTCTQTDVTPCIAYASLKWREPLVDLERVAFCESRDKWNADNGTDEGLFQFAPSTFASTPYAKYSIWSARYSALAAAWMWRVGRRDEWQCQ